MSDDHATHAEVHPARTGAAALTLGALGVVFGDIGTSPLYAMHEVFGGAHPMGPDPDRIHGVLSLIFWSLIIIVTLKYVLFIMRADNRGEGGIMALISLIQRSAMGRARLGMGLVLMGIFGAALFYGDGMITPAISVLSAVEGLEVAAPGVDRFVVPIALVIITLLFVVQRHGTGRVGAIFGPVMLVWFTLLAVLGVVRAVAEPGIFRALSPTYAVSFFVNHGTIAFLALGSVVLAVTGAEALYADMGHFGRPAIARAWILVALPALVLNYMGQGALLLADPTAVDNPFYRLAPDWGQIPLVVVATFATVIASQAVISGAFSVTRQAVQLGFLPRLTIRHTSDEEEGQVYVPLINWVLYIAIVALIIGFRSSTHLASAYGIAVTGTLAIDTILAFVVVRVVWKKPLWLALCGAAAFLVVDLAFFAANVTKFLHGGWFPIAVAVVVFILLSTWRRGRSLALTRIAEADVSTGELLQSIAVEQPLRVPGTAVYLTALSDGMPRPLVYNLSHHKVVHEQVVLFTSLTRAVPVVADDRRLTVTELGEGFVRVVAGYGFMELPDLPQALSLARDRRLIDIDLGTTSYFLSDTILNVTSGGGMAVWRKRLFAFMSRNSMHAAQFMRVPSDRVVEVGTPIEI